MKQGFLKYKKDQILKINIAHNEGNFFTDHNHLNELKDKNLIAFKYSDEKEMLVKIQILMVP